MLTALGHRVAVSALGPVSDAGDFGVPRFRCIPHQLIKKNPVIIRKLFRGCWQWSSRSGSLLDSREGVRNVARAITNRYGSPYIVHLEDNETALASIGATLEAPEMILEFVAGAAGATVIVDTPEIFRRKTWCYLLEPGVDSDMFAPESPRFRPQVSRRRSGRPRGRLDHRVSRHRPSGDCR